MARKFMVLYGKNSVAERLAARPHTIRKIFLQESFSEPEIEKLIRLHNIPVERVTVKALQRMRRGEGAQGIVARIDPFVYASFDEALGDQTRTLFFLDRIFDPHNLGSIIRTVACFGRGVVVIPAHKACGVTEAVLHVASGGENYVPVVEVANLTNAILAAKKSGYWIAGGFIGQESQDINTVQLPFPLGMVLGSEGEGIRYGVAKHLDVKVHIPMEGAQLSFNVNTACVIFCHVIAQQRKEA